MEIITSKKNKTIQSLKSLNTQKGRLEQGMFLVEGEHMVLEALKSNYKLETLICDAAKAERYSYLIDKSDNCIFAQSDVFNTICDTITPQGICAALSNFRFEEKYGTKIVMLNAVQDPGNVGTIVRTADAAGFSDVIMDDACADIYNPKTLRSTMGSIFHINCHRTSSLENVINKIKQEDYSIYATAIGGPNYFEREPDKEKIAIIFGNEGNGVDKKLMDIATNIYSLPMVGQSESLNVAVACGIMIYDIMRREI